MMATWIGITAANIMIACRLRRRIGRISSGLNIRTGIGLLAMIEVTILLTCPCVDFIVAMLVRMNLVLYNSSVEQYIF
jgi:hypothetical protein